MIFLRASILILLCALMFGSSIAEDSKGMPPENEKWLKHGNWCVILNTEQKGALAFASKKHKPMESPYLDITCYHLSDDGHGFDMALKQDNGFNTKDPLSVNVFISIDDGTIMEREWFPANDRLESVQPRALIKEMISSSVFNIKFRDKSGLKEYSYELNGLGDVIKWMESVCGYKFDGSH